jgi:hypothetical protein
MLPTLNKIYCILFVVVFFFSDELKKQIFRYVIGLDKKIVAEVIYNAVIILYNLVKMALIMIPHFCIHVYTYWNAYSNALAVMITFTMLYKIYILIIKVSNQISQKYGDLKQDLDFIKKKMQ